MQQIGFHLTSLPLFLLNEIRLMVQMYSYYKWSSIINTLMVAADFIWWIFLIDGGNIDSYKISPLLLGYLTWAYAYYFIYDAHYFIVENSQTGVLEQIYLSPYPFYLKLIARFFSGLIFCTLELTIVLATIMLFFNISIPFSFSALLVFIIILIGIAGFSLIVAGVGLIFKKSHPFAYLFNNLLLFFNGSILPLEKMPYLVQLFGKTLPTTQGIIVLKSITFGRLSLMEIIDNGSLACLILNTIAYLIAGWLIFIYCEKRAKNLGTIGHY